MIKYSPSVSCNINNVTGINSIIETCSIKITTIASNFKYTCINKPPLPTDVFEDSNTTISCINTTDIDDIERYNSHNLKDIAMKDIAKCSALSCENITRSVLLGNENFNNKYLSRGGHASCQLVPPLILNQHIHPLGISNQKIIVI